MSNPNVIEAMLLRWGESHSSGRTVTFQLPDENAPHPFKGLKCGPANGQRVALSIALIGDDETEEEPKQKRNWHDMPLSQQAAIKCGEPIFKRFLIDQYGQPGTESLSDDEAADLLRTALAVASRSELDKDDNAAKRWEALWSRFRAWELAG